MSYMTDKSSSIRGFDRLFPLCFHSRQPLSSGRRDVLSYSEPATAATSDEGTPVSNEVPAVSAAVRILERIAADLPKAVSPTVLVNELDLNRSTCYNILATLQRAGWVSKLEAREGGPSDRGCSR